MASVTAFSSPGNPDPRVNKYPDTLNVNKDGAQAYSIDVGGPALLTVVCDGVGENPDGVKFALAHVPKMVEEIKATKGGRLDPQELLARLIENLDSEVHNRGLNPFTAGFLLNGNGWAYGAKVGDVELYKRERNGNRFHWLAGQVDHPVWNELSDGEKRREASRKGGVWGVAGNHIIKNSIGGGPDNRGLNAWGRVRQLDPRATYLICSDGLGTPYNEQNVYVPGKALSERGTSLSEFLHRGMREGNDNVTAAIVQGR